MNKFNNKKTIIILILLLLVGIVGVTIAYFSNTTSINNLFSTKEYGTIVTEEFVSPDNWLPGTTTDKKINVTNSGKVDEAVRISYTEKWVAKDGTILSGLIDSNGNLINNTENSEHAAIINFSDNGDWNYSNGYYYYNYKLSPNNTTSTLIDSVTFNSKVKNSSNCTTTDNNGTKTITCNSTNNGYDGATYTLTFKVETIQYDKYKEAWGVNIETFGMKPMTAREFISKANPVSITNYTDGDIHEMYTFEHEATEQTPALTDYRYIGDDPYNYVYFNCDSLDNQNKDTCEVWRIIGVFDVEDEDGNWETRYKLVRGRAFENIMWWDDNSVSNNSYWNKHWTVSSLNYFLNNDFYNSSGESLSYGLKNSVHSLIVTTKYYLGGHIYDYESGYGNSNQVYSWERGYGSVKDIFPNEVTNDFSMQWFGKIGLMYPSDNYYTYANGVDNTCYNNPGRCYIGLENANPDKAWIYNSNIKDGDNNIYNDIWLLSPVISSGDALFFINAGGLNSSNGLCGVRPVLYLKSNVKLVDGNGKIDNPYKLGYNSSDSGYETYTKGQTVTYDNQEYYVMSDSEGDRSYVKLLKKEPLIANEINNYNTSYTSTNGEYPYLENNSCTSGNTSNCSTNYDSSSIKTIIDNWSNGYNNDLVSINGYKARLVNEKDIMNNFSYEKYVSGTYIGIRKTNDTPEWAYINGSKYWSMQVSEDSNTQIYGVSNSLTSENVYNKLYIRPVINLKKCALTNTCE